MADVQVELRQYAQLAYERDLQANMMKLHDYFGQWQQGDISVWQIDNSLSDFVNGTSRALHTTYTLTDPVFSVAYAVKKGVLTLEEIPSELHGAFSHLMNTISI